MHPLPTQASYFLSVDGFFQSLGVHPPSYLPWSWEYVVPVNSTESDKGKAVRFDTHDDESVNTSDKVTHFVDEKLLHLQHLVRCMLAVPVKLDSRVGC